MESKMVIAFLLLLTSANVFTTPDATESEGGKCPPGHFMLNPEDPRPCRPCPPGTYQSKYNRAPECLLHTESCQEQKEEKVSEGNGTQDIVCQCPEGQERKYIIHDPFNGIFELQIIKYLCIPCPAGYVAKPVSNPLKPGDTHCCLPHLFPVRRDFEFLCENATITTTTSNLPPTTSNLPPTTSNLPDTTSNLPDNTTAAPPATTELGSTASTATSTAHQNPQSSPPSTSSNTSVMTTSAPAVTGNLSIVNPDGVVHKSAEGWSGNPVVYTIVVTVGLILILCLLAVVVVCCCRRHPESRCGRLLPERFHRQAVNPAVAQPEAPAGEHCELLDTDASSAHRSNDPEACAIASEEKETSRT